MHLHVDGQLFEQLQGADIDEPIGRCLQVRLVALAADLVGCPCGRCGLQVELVVVRIHESVDPRDEHQCSSMAAGCSTGAGSGSLLAAGWRPLAGTASRTSAPARTMSEVDARNITRGPAALYRNPPTRAPKIGARPKRTD